MKEDKKTDLRFCKDCKWYNKSTERDFHRKVGKRDEKGERTEIVELRAICRNKKSKSFGHLVMAEYSKRQCEFWEKGKYVPPEKPKALQSKALLGLFNPFRESIRTYPKKNARAFGEKIVFSKRKTMHACMAQVLFCSAD